MTDRVPKRFTSINFFEIYEFFISKWELQIKFLSNKEKKFPGFKILFFSYLFSWFL